MPIYMDRHDVSELITAENVAMLHQQDLKIQDEFNCRGLTYWFDDIRKTAFCLIEAPDERTLKKMHNKAHGQVPHTVIEVDPGIVESFLGRIEDPEKARDAELNIINEPAFRTIMTVHINERLLKKSQSAAAIAARDEFNNSIPGILKSYEGSPVKKSADEFMVSFKSVLNAVHASIEILAKFKKAGKDIKNNKPILKIALTAGAPVTTKKQIFEDAIKLAERMCEHVEGDIIVSSEVKDLYKSENSNSFINDKSIVALAPEDEKFLDGLINYIESVWANPNLKVDDFSRPLGCSKSQLYRKLISLTGQSPNAFIKEYRLKEALKLLNKNSGNVSEIAFETGFTSPSYFSKCFQKRYGHSPSDYLHINFG